MLRSRLLQSILLSFAIPIVALSERVCAEPMLLVEIHNTGYRQLTSGQPEMGFSFRVVPAPEWGMVLTAADVGKTFSIPSELLQSYSQHLTKSDSVFIDLACCEDLGHGFVSPSALNFGYSQADVLTVTRVAPNLGPNLVGYRLTDITQTIDDITITFVPGSGFRYNRRGAHTVRIYGDVVPEPSAFALISISTVVYQAFSFRLHRARLDLDPIALCVRPLENPHP